MAVKGIVFRGHRFNQRTIDMMKEAEVNLQNLFGDKTFRIEITQGSFTMKVPESKETHKGGGVVDIRVKHLDRPKQKAIVFELRRVGFAAYLRGVTDSLSIHIHAVAVGDPELSTGPLGALAQVKDYFDGKNGLKGHGKDTGPRFFVSRTWERYKQLRSTVNVTPAATAAAKKTDVFLRVRALRMAASGDPISDTFAFDAEKFMAFAAAGQNAAMQTLVADWRRSHDQKLFVKGVKAVQKRLNLLEDGDPGPVTLAWMEQFGYFSTP